MAWVHDTGYLPAYDHTGYPVSVLLDGTETASSSARTASEVIGWRSACECGWRGMQFYPRSEWPSSTGIAPDGVDGWETGSAFAEWDRHLDRVLPELAVHDLAQQLADVEERLQAAVQAARFAGLSWSRISAVAGTSPDRAAHRWGPAGQHSRAIAPDWSAGCGPSSIARPHSSP
jgi:hypothetical protein